jgi:hypothetical protein
VVRAEGSHPRGCGSNPAIYWMDVSNASYYIFNEKENKGSQMGHTKKKYLKKLNLCSAPLKLVCGANLIARGSFE